MIEVRDESYGRVVEWDAPDGNRYLWAVDRRWVQNAGSFRTHIESASDFGPVTQLELAGDFINASGRPAEMVTILESLELTDAELMAHRADLLREARDWNERFQAVQARQDAAASRKQGCAAYLFGAFVLFVVAPIVSLVALASARPC